MAAPVMAACAAALILWSYRRSFLSRRWDSQRRRFLPMIARHLTFRQAESNTLLASSLQYRVVMFFSCEAGWQLG